MCDRFNSYLRALSHVACQIVKRTLISTNKTKSTPTKVIIEASSKSAYCWLFAYSYFAFDGFKI